MNETWKPIDGLGHYEVSNLGEIRNWANPNGHQSRFHKPHFVAPWRMRAGYLMLNAHVNGKKSRHLVHRLVATAFYGEGQPGQQVNHKNGIKSDNRAENLEWVTHQQNALHSVRVLGNGLGAKNSFAKLTDDDVRAIRARRERGEPITTLMQDYGVSDTTCYRICNRRIWKHLTEAVA